MQWIIQLGFELQMYHTDEWPGLYWYLCETAEHRQSHLERIISFVKRHAAKLGSHSSSEQRLASEHCLEFLTVAREESIATTTLAESFACLYQALSDLQLLPKPPPRPYGTTELRHALRQRPFLPLILPAVASPSTPFDSIARLADALPMQESYASAPPSHRTALILLDAVQASSKEARRSLEVVTKASAASAGCEGCEADWRAGIKDVQRAAVMAGIAGAKVRKWVLDGARDKLVVEVHSGTRDDEMPRGMAAAWMAPQVAS